MREGPITLRPATAEDARDILAWRNDPLTRAMSRSQDPVEASAHMAWFERALADPRCILLIGEAGGGKVGMVRFDEAHELEVSINLNPDRRGQGLSRPLLAAALADRPGPVVAMIKPENLASRRLFESLGFRFQELREGLGRYVRPGAGGAP